MTYGAIQSASEGPIWAVSPPGEAERGTALLLGYFTGGKEVAMAAR